ncbi:MAG: hypothetical protein HF308_14370 [Ignavibacteria bacterium]|jgi:phage minor structural protein|nr:hypothetical protein [Ignavibacteria bacterium]
MALIHVLDRQTDEIIDTLNSNKGEYWEAIRHDSLTAENTFDCTIDASLVKAENLAKLNRLVIQDEDGNFREYIIRYLEQTKRTQKLVQSDASFITLKKAKIIDPQTITGTTAQLAVEMALSGTEWTAGVIDYTDVQTIIIDKRTNPYDFLKQIAEIFGLEITFRVAVVGNKVIGRYVDFKIHTVGFDGKEITFGKDLIDIRRKEDSSRIVTSLLGVYKTKDGIELTTWAEDNDAFQRWSRKGQALVDWYEPDTNDDNMTNEKLYALTQNELKKRIDSIVTYDGTAASIEYVFGKEHEKIRVGQTVRIKDTGYNPPLYLEARIQELERDYITKRIKSYKIGNYVVFKKEDLEKQVAKLKSVISDKLSKMITCSIVSSAGNVFKNSSGQTILTANVFIAGQETDLDGSRYTYTWHKYDKDGILVDSYVKSGKSVSVIADEITEKSVYSVDISIDGTVLFSTDVTIVDISDGGQGPTGKGVNSITRHYLVSSSSSGVTTATNGWSTDPQVMTTTLKYLWGYDTIAYTDSTSTTTTPAIIGVYGDTGNAGKGISSVTEYYLATNASTGVTTATTGWTTTVQNVSNSLKYLWNYEKTTYTDGSTSSSIPIIIGAYGDSGKGIDTVTEYYLATDVSTGVTSSTSGWTTSIQTLTATKKYLWNYEEVTYTDGTFSTVTPVVIGTYGDKGDKGDPGNGIGSVTEYYLVTSASSGVTTATAGWTTTMQTVTATNKYLWNYEKVTYTDGSTSNTIPVIVGVYGDTGKGISSVVNYYLATSASTGVTTVTSGWTTSVQNVTSTNKYLWNYEVTTYTDNSTISSTPVIIGAYGDKGDKGDSGKGISSVTNYYLATNASSGVTTATAGWTTSVQNVSNSLKYLWNYETVTYTDSTTSSTPPSIIGAYGDTGGTGKGISSVTEYYLATAASTGVTTATSGWTTSIQTVTATNKYLWNYEVTTYTDNSTISSTPVVIGVYGDKGDKGDSGKGISSVTNYYLASASSSGVTIATSGWTTSVQNVTSTNKYLWNYETVTYSDNTTSSTTPVIIGAYGDTGNAGKGISSVTEYYLATASSSGVTTATAGWTTSIQSISATNKYLWNYEKITYTDSTTSNTTPVIIGVYGDKGDKGDQGAPGIAYMGPTAPANAALSSTWFQTDANTGKVVAINKWNGSGWDSVKMDTTTLAVDKLSALSADLGDVTAGNINGVHITTNDLTLRRPDGYEVYTNGTPNFDFGVIGAAPPFMDSGVSVSGYWYTMSQGAKLSCQFYTFKRTSRYLKVMVALYAGNASSGAAITIAKTGGTTLASLVTYDTNPNSTANINGQIITVDLGVPDGQWMGIYVYLNSGGSPNAAYGRVISIWKEG